MNYYAIANGLNSFIALSIFLLILAKKARQPIQRTQALFCLLLFSWTFSYFIWGFQTDKEKSLFWIQLLNYPCCVIHIAYFHFVLIFSNNEKRYRKTLLCGYALGFLCMIINAFNGFYDLSYIRAKPPFPYWPHASLLYPFLISVMVLYTTLGHIILFKAIRKNDEPLRTKLKYFLVISIIGWTGGLMNFCYFYDSIPVPPAGNFAVTFYIVAVTYLIFMHDLLQLNLVVKKTFLYAALTLFITLTYTLFIIIFEKFSQQYLGYRSLLATLLAALTIAVLFNPIRNSLTSFFEKHLFGKNIAELSVENLQMKLELQKQDQFKAISTLAAGMAHEIKNPLTTIKTFSNCLPEKKDDPEFLERFSRVVGPEIEKIDGIVKQLLDFSKPSPLKLEKTDIQKIIRETLEFLRDELLKKRVETRLDFYDSQALILGDKKQLQQVFLNLFLNSIQAMPGGGILTVKSSRSPESSLVITVSDTGAGIPKESLEQVFEPFFTTKDAGTGLGLSIVKGIVEEHGGKITAESAAGAGTTIRISLKA